jgi:hypothetical protein
LRTVELVTGAVHTWILTKITSLLVDLIVAHTALLHAFLIWRVKHWILVRAFSAPLLITNEAVILADFTTFVAFFTDVKFLVTVGGIAFLTRSKACGVSSTFLVPRLDGLEVPKRMSLPALSTVTFVELWLFALLGLIAILAWCKTFEMGNKLIAF